MDQLGLADKNKFHEFHSEDKLLAFTRLVRDFEFLTEDFFDGRCQELIIFSNLQDIVLFEYGGNSRIAGTGQNEYCILIIYLEIHRNRIFKPSLNVR